LTVSSVIETGRLRLRPYTRDDIEPLRAVFADAYARRFYPLMGEAEKLAAWIEWNLAMNVTASACGRSNCAINPAG